jgi:hypothetical protein
VVSKVEHGASKAAHLFLFLCRPLLGSEHYNKNEAAQAVYRTGSRDSWHPWYFDKAKSVA